MLRLEIPTNPIAGTDNPGATIATLLRSVADQIEAEVQIVPLAAKWDEWTTETYRHARRINGTLVGAVFTIEKD